MNTHHNIFSMVVDGIKESRTHMESTIVSTRVCLRVVRDCRFKMVQCNNHKWTHTITLWTCTTCHNGHLCKEDTCSMGTANHSLFNLECCLWTLFNQDTCLIRTLVWSGQLRADTWLSWIGKLHCTYTGISLNIKIIKWIKNLLHKL